MFTHGLSGYSNYDCRCKVCTEAHRVNHLRYMHAHPEQQARHAKYMRERRATLARGGGVSYNREAVRAPAPDVS